MPTTKKFKSPKVLDKIFDELNTINILSKQNFACCMNCGSSDLRKELEEDNDYIGFCFYHDQDRESAAETGELYLAYSGATGYAKDDKKIAKKIVHVCKKYGLKPEWNGDIDTRIKLYLPKAVVNKLKHDIEEENETFINENDSDHDE